MSSTLNGTDPAAFLSLVAKYLKLLGDPGSLSMSSNLYDLGLDSTGALNLLLELEETHAITFPDSLLSDATFETPAALHAALISVINAQRPAGQPS